MRMLTIAKAGRTHVTGNWKILFIVNGRLDDGRLRIDPGADRQQCHIRKTGIECLTRENDDRTSE
jgi:hypothetical protein